MVAWVALAIASVSLLLNVVIVTGAIVAIRKMRGMMGSLGLGSTIPRLAPTSTEAWTTTPAGTTPAYTTRAYTSTPAKAKTS